MNWDSEDYCPELYEPYEQPALPRKTGLRALPIVLVSIIVLVSAVVTLLSLLGVPLGVKHLAGGETIHPTVVGEAEPEPKPLQNEGGDTPPDTVLSVSPAPSVEEETLPEPDGALSLQEIYRKVIDAVVCVQAVSESGSSVGTGVVLSSDGYLITNYHVIEGMFECTVLLSDDTEYTAELVGSDEQTDLAVLKIAAENLAAAEFGDSESLEVGDTVAAIGNPLGTELRGTMTDGIVSAINRDIVVDGREMTVIQTNAALNSGSSGGPLINIYGQVVGINTAKFSSYYSSAVEGIGFAIPISTVKPIVDELIEFGYISGRPSLGITGDSVPQYAQIYYRLPDGVYITAVDETSDAYAKGIREDDIVLAVGDVRVTSAEELAAAKNQYQVGDTVTLTVYHSGLYYYIDVTLGEMGAAS